MSHKRWANPLWNISALHSSTALVAAVVHAGHRVGSNNDCAVKIIMAAFILASRKFYLYEPSEMMSTSSSSSPKLSSLSVPVVAAKGVMSSSVLPVVNAAPLAGGTTRDMVLACPAGLVDSASDGCQDESRVFPLPVVVFRSKISTLSYDKEEEEEEKKKK